MTEPTVAAIIRRAQTTLTLVANSLATAQSLSYAQGLNPTEIKRMNRAVKRIRITRSHLAIIATALEFAELTNTTQRVAHTIARSF